MSRTILSRLGAGVVATALVAGGSLLVAAPASAANDIVTPNSVTENTWGTEGGLTVSGTGTPGDDLSVDITTSNTGEYDYFVESDKDVEIGADGTYSVTFSWTEENNEFTAFPQVGDTPFALIRNVTEGSEVADVFLPITVTAFVVDPNPTTTIVPTCLTGAQVQTTGVEFASTGYAQYEDNVTYSVKDAGGTVVGDAIVAVDGTGTARDAIRLFTTVNGVESGPIADGVYSITVTNGTVGSFAKFTVGDCTVPVVPAAPAAVAAAPQLANTGSSDAGILVGGSALLLLVGAALVVARRRTNAAA